MSDAIKDVIHVRIPKRPSSPQEEQLSQKERSRKKECNELRRDAERNSIPPTLEQRLADYQSRVDRAKIALPVAAHEATSNGRNIKERVSSKVGELYITHGEPPQGWLVVLRLPLRDLPSVGMTGTLKGLGLFRNAPSYVVLDVDSDQHQWKDGYGDGETSAHLRKVPVAYLTSVNSPERIAAEWITEEDLHALGADWNTNFDRQNVDNCSNSRRSAQLRQSSQEPVTRKPAPCARQASRTNLQSQAPGYKTTTLPHGGQPTSGDTMVANAQRRLRSQKAPEVLQKPQAWSLPGLMKVFWPEELPPSIVQLIAKESPADRISTLPEDLWKPVEPGQYQYCCPLCPNIRYFLTLEPFTKHLIEHSEH
ncbi:hypothetical protein FPRO05_14057 [Fusarium proliferatum]|uniref:Uncharacterized protein n=1 Tax=Gibberella intermedia TaxID=948311 RepID=A0A365MWE9_GIBIN|nr:hypothetical protein FPRO05_14057 [Fusarium proliferatum]